MQDDSAPENIDLRNDGVFQQKAAENEKDTESDDEGGGVRLLQHNISTGEK